MIFKISQAQPNDPDFQIPPLGTGPAAYQYGPVPGAPWTLSGGAGLAGNGSDFTSANPDAPNGTQVLFLQEKSEARQQVTISAGTWRVSVWAAQRLYDGVNKQTFHIRLGKEVVGTFTPTDGNYALCTSDAITLAAGTWTLALVGTNPLGGDNTVFLSHVLLENLMGNIYNVGPNQTYSGLVDLFTTHGVTLVPGDTVNVYPMYNTDGSVKPYYEKPFLYWSGSAGNPITFQGVPDTNGNLPILDGTNAVETLVPDGYTGIDYHNPDGSWSEYGNVGLLTLLPPLSWNDTDVYSYWNIRNLKVQNCTQDRQYVRSRDGALVNYAYGYGIYFAIATDMLVENCEITGCSGGILFPCYLGKPLNQNITIQLNYIHDIVGGSGTDYDRIHAVYGEAYNTLYDRNHIVNIGAAAFGIKDRGAGTVVSHCYIANCGSAAVDLVEPEGGYSSLRQLEPTGTQKIYGCTLVNTQERECIIFGWDNQVDDDNGNRLAQTTLLSAYNTLVCYNPGSYYVYPWKVKDTCFVVTQDDILHQSGSAQYYIVVSDNPPTVGTVTANVTTWVDSGYLIDTDCILNGAANLTTGTDPLFTDPTNSDFSLQASSPCVGIATSLPADWTYPTWQYDISTGTFVQRTSHNNLGAVE